MAQDFIYQVKGLSFPPSSESGKENVCELILAIIATARHKMLGAEYRTSFLVLFLLSKLRKDVEITL